MTTTRTSDIAANLSETQYYCEKCNRIYEYRYPEQMGCEVCNTSIDDDQIAHIAQV